MNRTIALFLALIVLLAHTLAIYTSVNGDVAPPYDLAHVAYRIARNFVQSGSLAWFAGEPIGESYPSLAWIAVAAVGERMYLPVTTYCQFVGVVAALATVLVLAKFSPGRLAGVIAPVLFVVSGPIAAAAGSGTEISSTALLITLSFLAYERGWRVVLAASLAATAVVRAEGAFFCGMLFAFEIARAFRRGLVYPRIWPFLAPIAAIALTALWRHSQTGSFLSPAGEELFLYDRERTESGLQYLRDFVVSSGAPFLLIIPLWYALRGGLRGTGLRALILSLAWAALIGWMGGGPLPFSARMAPIISVWFVAVQEGMTIALDSRRRMLPEFTWTLFLLGIATSALASKYPGNLGPLETERLHRAWMTPHTTGPFGYSRPLGRLGLAEEIEATERLRALGILLRDQLEPGDTVLTAWPGAVGYLSRLRVYDVLGRATPAAESGELRSWTSLPRADVVAALDARPSYVMPLLASGQAPTVQDVATAWALRLDVRPDDKARSLEILDRLRDYELITVALGPSSRAAGHPVEDDVYLLRRRDLGLAPRLSVRRAGERFVVEVEHRAHEQLVDLRVTLLDEQRRAFTLRPNGEWTRDATVLARSSLLLYPTGTRKIEVAAFELPASTTFAELRVELRNCDAQGDGLFAEAATPVVVPLAR